MKFIPDKLLATASNWQRNLLSQSFHVKRKKVAAEERKKTIWHVEYMHPTDGSHRKKSNSFHLLCDRVQMINHEDMPRCLSFDVR